MGRPKLGRSLTLKLRKKLYYLETEDSNSYSENVKTKLIEREKVSYPQLVGS